MPPLPKSMPPLPILITKKEEPVLNTELPPVDTDEEEAPAEKIEHIPVPAEYLQKNKSWFISEEELPQDYKSRWESEESSKRRSGWGPKTFSAPCFNYLPFHEKSINEIEVLIRKHRIDDLTKRIII